MKFHKIIIVLLTASIIVNLYFIFQDDQEEISRSQYNIEDTLSIVTKSLELELIDSLKKVHNINGWFFSRYPYLINYNLDSLITDKIGCNTYAYYEAIPYNWILPSVSIIGITFTKDSTCIVDLNILNRYFALIRFKKKKEWSKTNLVFRDDYDNIQFYKNF